MRSLIGLVVVGLLVMTACKKEQAAQPAPSSPSGSAKAPEPAAPAAVAAPRAIATDAEFEKVGTSLVEQMVAIFKGTATDCDQRAAQMNSFMDARDLDIKAMNAYAEAHPAVDTALDAKLDSLMRSVQEHYALTPNAALCDDHKGFNAAMERYP